MDANSRDISLEAALASFETTLEQHTKLIENMAGKVDDMDRTMTMVKIQMEHLVTKESCSEGRKELAEDLKARMDGDREITGVGITVPDLWQKYVEATRGQAAPAAPAPTTAHPSPSKGRTTTSYPPPPKPAIYYIKAISSIVSLVFAVIAITFFAYKVVDRMDSQQVVMQDIQRNLKQLETTKQAAIRRFDDDADDALPQPPQQSRPLVNPGD